MKIIYIKIKNFKSISELEINDIENALILVGKNNTGKTSIIDAILLASNLKAASEHEFLDINKPIEISMQIEFTEDDLNYYYSRGILCKANNFEKWFEEFKEKFKQCGISTFGSGWAWLVSDKDGKLEIMSTKDQSSPISLGLIPILTMDVWEHAYYLKYQNRRPEYIDYFFDIINWKKCEEYYNNR